MKYRVIIKVSYHDAWFEFDSIAEAGSFAETVLVHQIPNEDTKTKSFITIPIALMKFTSF